MKKRFFVEILREICEEEGLKFEVFSYDWLCKITDERNLGKGEVGKYTWTEGYNFDLNSAVSYLSLYDKVSTSTILTNANVPNVGHYLVMKGEYRRELEVEKTWQVEVEEILKITGLPVVCKPTSGSRGLSVCLSSAKQDVLNLVSFMQQKVSVAICKYYESKYEYRFYLLEENGEVETMVAYKKIKSINKNGEEDWKHNLSLTAVAEIINEKNFTNYLQVEKLAKEAFRALGLRAGAVDILDTKEGYKILEINNGIMMDKFASFSAENYKIAKEIHRKMLFTSNWFS